MLFGLHTIQLSEKCLPTIYSPVYKNILYVVVNINKILKMLVLRRTQFTPKNRANFYMTNDFAPFSWKMKAV